MRHGKAAGQSHVVSETLKASGEVGIDWLAQLCNNVLGERKIPEDWRSVLDSVYKGKGDQLVQVLQSNQTFRAWHEDVQACT